MDGNVSARDDTNTLVSSRTRTAHDRLCPLHGGICYSIDFKGGSVLKREPLRNYPFSYYLNSKSTYNSTATWAAEQHERNMHVNSGSICSTERFELTERQIDAIEPFRRRWVKTFRLNSVQRLSCRFTWPSLDAHFVKSCCHFAHVAKVGRTEIANSEIGSVC